MEGLKKLLHGINNSSSKQHVEDLLRERLLEDGYALGDNECCSFAFAKRVAHHLVTDKLTSVSDDGEDIIGVTELATVKMGLEVVVAWWLLPLLDEGVGFALDRRTTQSKVKVAVIGRGSDRYANVWKVMSVLLKLLKTPLVMNLVLESHVPDLMAGFLQIIYGPDSPAEWKDKCKPVFFSLLNAWNVDVGLENMLLFVGPNAPEWLSSAVGQLLSRTLLRPHAVEALMTSLLADRPTGHLQEGIFDRTAVLVTVVPRSHKDRPSEFYTSVCTQLLACFRSKIEAVRTCSAICCERMLRQDPETVIQKLMTPLMQPLMSDGATEQQLDNCIQDLSLLMLPCGGGGNASAKPFWAFIVPSCARRLLLLGCAIIGTACRLSTLVSSTLETMMRIPLEDDVRRSLAKAMILDPKIPSEGEIVFSLGPTGGAVSKRAAKTRRNWSRECSVFFGAVKNAPAGLLGDIFSEAIQYVSAVQADPSNPRYLLMLELASELLQCPSLLEDAYQILVLLRALVSSDDVSEQVLELVLMVLKELLPKLRLGQHEEILLTDLVIPLEAAGQLHKSMLADCLDVCNKIRDPAASWRITGAVFKIPENASAQFEAALRDLEDPLVPVRAHALIGLRKLILAKDPVTLQNFSRVLELFKTQLRSEDSYIYLGAIHGLSALGDVNTTQTLPFVVSDFHNQTLSLQVRVKLGEVMVLIAQRCGQLLPVYAPVMMDCFFRGIKDPEPDVRASSLSNIGFMCEILNWGLHPYIHEILSAVRAILETEKDIVVRRAGVVVLGLIVRGLGREKLNAMAKERVQELIDVMHRLANGDADEMVRGHADVFIQDMKDEFLLL